MYNYDELYEKVMDYTNSLNLEHNQSVEIINKIAKDVDLGLLKQRNIEKKVESLAYNRAFTGNESINSYYDILQILAIENQWDYVKGELLNTTKPYDECFFSLIPEATIQHRLKIKQIQVFIDHIKPKLQISDSELAEFKLRLLRYARNNEITTNVLNNMLEMYLEETQNDSFKMVRNQDFRKLDKKFVAIKNPDLALKFHEDDSTDVDSLICYSYIDHEKGISFLVLTTAFEGEMYERIDFSKDYIIAKKDVEDEVIEFIDSCDDYLNYIDSAIDNSEKYAEIRNYALIDEARDKDNPDLVKVEFISPDSCEHLLVSCENIIGSKIIGETVENSTKIKKLKKGMQVVVSYSYDFKDRLRLYVYIDDDFDKLSGVIEEINKEYEKCPTKGKLIEQLSKYKSCYDFDEVIDAFHSLIFDYFRDLNEFYRVLAI